MKALLVALGLALLPAGAWAANTLTWDQTPTTATGVSVERSGMTGNKCLTFSEIATVPFGTLTYIDATAGNAQCYRVRNWLDLDDGAGTVTKIYSGYSNVSTKRPGNPNNLQVP